MMAQQNHEESIETSSDFMECKMARTPTEESEKDVQGYFADPEKLKEFLSCVKCKQEFDHDTHKPFLLPCSDAVCKSCTQAISSLESQSYECHKCHCDHICFQNDKTNLQTDSTRELVTKIFRLTSGKTNLACEMCTNNKLVSHRCFECSLFICTDCVKLHSILKALGSHSFVEINRLLTTKMENHKRVSCEENAAENACETTIEVFRKKLDLIVKQARKSLAELENIDTKSQQDLQKVQEEIKTHFREVKKAIEEREKMLYDAVATKLSKKQSCIEFEKVQLNLFIGLCEQASYYGEFSEINNHEYFLDIAKTIQSRLDTSERHFSKNKVSMDAMKFSTQPEFSFKTAVNSIGKLSVSKAISSKSKVEVKPAFCHVGQEVQFQVQLFSSTGKIVVDEDVYLCLMVNRKIFKNIKCAIDESISSFIGIWVPGEPMKLSWIVVSNDITLATLNGVLDVNEPNESICDDEEKQISEVVMTPKTATKCNKDVSGKASDSRFTGVKTRENTSSYIEGSLKLKVINQKKKYTTRVNSINMSEKDFRKMLFFGDKLYWFKDISLKLNYDGKTLCIQSDVDDDRVEKLQNLFKSIQMMSADDFVIHGKDINVLLVMQEVERLKPKVCMIRTGNKIEIIAENYIDLVETKSLLQQKCSSEQISRRDGRSFAEKQDNRSQLIAETNRTPPNFQTSFNLDKHMRIQALEVNTKKGLMIKIYAGSITRLDVDCIVCASNDQLMHGGGVAAAISEAAGYQFDLESKNYIQKHGPIPVGRCCVTSAGKLPYKCVIHAIGPRWHDYRDKNRCLLDLQDCVELTLREADNRRMKSIAIPAISSGIFAVPRDLCVQQYYKAVMSFNRNYPCNGLREIHFVDRDESIVRVIQEIFQLPENRQ